MNPRKLQPAYSALLAVCFGISLFCLIYPVYVIRPFRHQGVHELGTALAILRLRLLLMPVCAVAAVAIGALYWRAQPGKWRRVFAALSVFGVAVSTGLARVNIYELMFHPIGSPVFAPGRETKLDKDEKVIAVDLAGTARAYPIRSLSYHHIVNDVVAGVPIAATY